MSNSLVNDLLAQLQGAPVQQMAAQIGADPATAQNAVAAALPMLMGALGANAQQPGGAAQLLGALQRDHAGASALDVGSLLGGLLGGSAGASGHASGSASAADALGGLLGSVLGGGAQTAPSRQLDAGGILGHIFGGAQAKAEAGLGQATGLNSTQSAQLLKMLAPIVMAFLAKQVSARGMDAGQLGQTLGQERAKVQQQGGLAGGLLGAVLDQNGDGKLDMGDLLKLGGSLLKR